MKIVLSIMGWIGAFLVLGGLDYGIASCPPDFPWSAKLALIGISWIIFVVISYSVITYEDKE
jgi:hypothetical protein